LRIKYDFLTAISSGLTVEHGGGLIMVWAGFTAGGTGNVLLAEGRIDSDKYHQIQRANIRP